MTLLNKLTSAAQAAMTKLRNAMASLTVLALSAPAFALNKTDLTQDQSGGKKLQDVLANADDAAQTTATFVIGLVAIGGYVVVALSLYGLYKASKDDRGNEKPLASIIGLFIGGAMAGVGTIMWIMRGTLLN